MLGLRLSVSRGGTRDSVNVQRGGSVAAVECVEAFAFAVAIGIVGVEGAGSVDEGGGIVEVAAAAAAAIGIGIEGMGGSGDADGIVVAIVLLLLLLLSSASRLLLLEHEASKVQVVSEVLAHVWLKPWGYARCRRERGCCAVSTHMQSSGGAGLTSDCRYKGV